MTTELEYEDQIPEDELLDSPPTAPVRGAPPAAESGFSINWSMTGNHGEQAQITMRGALAADWMTVLRERTKLLDMAQKAGWTFGPGARPTASAPAAAPAANGSGIPGVGSSVPSLPATTANWQPPAPTGPVTPTVAGGGFASVERQSFVAVKMQIAPRPDGGKTDVKLFAAGHQYADITITKKPEELAAAFAKTGPWIADHFREIKTYEPISYVVEWTPGRPNSQGRPYKDLADIRPA